MSGGRNHLCIKASAITIVSSKPCQNTGRLPYRFSRILMFMGLLFRTIIFRFALFKGYCFLCHNFITINAFLDPQSILFRSGLSCHFPVTCYMSGRHNINIIFISTLAGILYLSCAITGCFLLDRFLIVMHMCGRIDLCL